MNRWSILLCQVTVILIQVTVIDEDDNPPRFAHLFHSTVREDIEVGSKVIQVYSQDADGSANHTFAIENVNNNAPFRIDERTGWIYTSKLLDRENVCSRYPLS